MTTHTKAELEADMDRYVEESKLDMERAAELVAQDPKLPLISAYIIASNMRQADRSLDWLRSGKYDWGRAEAFCGSYGRLDLRVRARAEGLITDEQAFADLPSTWSGSDPDDTDPRFLALWHDAHAANGGRLLTDKPKAKLPGGAYLTVYRGQDPVDTSHPVWGISWSLDYAVALKFANGAATRQHHRNGVVYTTEVWRKDILAYMTGRSEQEVIIDPRDLVDITEV